MIMTIMVIHNAHVQLKIFTPVHFRPPAPPHVDENEDDNGDSDEAHDDFDHLLSLLLLPILMRNEDDYAHNDDFDNFHSAHCRPPAPLQW